MKKLLIVLGILIALLITSLYLDLRLTRGFWIDVFYLEKKFGDEFKNERVDADNSMVYTIEANENGTYFLSFKNYSIIPKYFLAYRDSIYESLNDKDFFLYSTRCSIQFPDTTVDNGWWSLGSCGTGIENTSINPFECFQIDKTRKELFSGYFVSGLLSYKNDSCYYDYINSQRLFCIDESYEYHWAHDSEEFGQDSIDVQFYLPVYSYFTGNESFVYSNKLRVSYSDLISYLQEDIESDTVDYVY